MELGAILRFSAAGFAAILFWYCGFMWYWSRNKTNSETPGAAINNETNMQTPGNPQHIHTQTPDTGLGSLYPLPRRQCETTTADTSVIIEPITVTDPPPSYNEVIANSTTIRR